MNCDWAVVARNDDAFPVAQIVQESARTANGGAQETAAVPKQCNLEKKVRRKFSLLLIAAIVFSLAVAPNSFARQSSSSPATVEHQAAAGAVQSTPPADPKDVETADALIASLYDVISGPAGKPGNWERMYSLFFPGALLIRTAPGKSGKLEALSMTPKDYVERAGKYFETHPFFERETSRKTHSQGDLQQIFSSYESSEDAAFTKPFAHGSTASKCSTTARAGGSCW